MVSNAWALTVQPMRLELAGRAGEALSGEFILSNDRGYPVSVTVSPDRYPAMPLSETSAPAEPLSCVSWISVAPLSVEIAPGQASTIRFQIVVPPGVTQEHAGAIRFDVEQAATAGMEQPTAPGQGRLLVTTRLTVPVYVAIEGYEQPEVSIGQVTIGQVTGERRFRIGVELVNSGLAHVRPLGHLTIMNEDRRVVALLPIGRSLPLLPGQRGEIPVYWKPEMPGRFTAVAVVNVGDLLLEQQQTFLFEGWP